MSRTAGGALGQIRGVTYYDRTSYTADELFDDCADAMAQVLEEKRRGQTQDVSGLITAGQQSPRSSRRNMELALSNSDTYRASWLALQDALDAA